MIASDPTAQFVERQRRERLAAGLGETITDERIVATVAALVACPPRPDDNVERAS